MLRLTVAPLRESVLIVAQTRDRNGHAADGSDAADASVYGGAPQRGFAAHPSGTQASKYPLADIDRHGGFGAILIENDIVSDSGLPAFYEYVAELSDPDRPALVPFPVVDPEDSSSTLWCYVGNEFAFRSMYVRLAGAAEFDDGPTLAVEYWNGSEWTAITIVEGDRLDVLRGLSDQLSWERLSDWFPCTISHQQAVSEGSRLVVGREIFWVRMRLQDLDLDPVLPELAGLWEGDERAEDLDAWWPNVIRPEKLVAAKIPMNRDANAHLASSPVVTRKPPSLLLTGRADLGRGDYFLSVPTYGGDVSVISKDPSSVHKYAAGVGKNGAAVTIPAPAEPLLLKPGRYRVRVYGEIPNLDASVFASASGHQQQVPDPALGTPGDPEGQFDPSWAPALSAAVACFDVRLNGAFAQVDIQRTLAGADAYTMWLEQDKVRVPLVNQGDAKDYARLVVQDAATGAVIIDTMDAAKCVSDGPIAPMPGVSGVDMHAFRYVESDDDRKLQDRAQLHLTVTIVRGEEAFVGRSTVAFYA